MNRRGFFGRMLAGLVASKLPVPGTQPVLPGSVPPLVPPVTTRTVVATQSSFIGSYYDVQTDRYMNGDVFAPRHTPPRQEEG